MLLIQTAHKVLETAIENQGQADALGIIVSRAKQIKRDADAARKEDTSNEL